MKKLIILLFLLVNLTSYATHFTFGTPGSSASLTSMSGHSMGDTAYIAAGNYTTLTLQNLDSIHIMALDTANQPVFSQQASVNSNRNTEISYLKFIYSSGSTSAWQMNGGADYNNNYHNLYFYGWTGSVFTKHNSASYTFGTHSTAFSWKDKWHDIVIDSCGQFMQGSFWNASAFPAVPQDIFVEDTIYNIQDIATSSSSGQGTGIRGAFFQTLIHDCYITDRSGRGASGDVGWVYITAGSAHLYNIYKWGGPGYIYRNNTPLSEYGFAFSNWLYNSGKFGGTEYGLVSVDAIFADTVAGKTYVPIDSNWNLTLGNQFNDTLGYQSSLMNMGGGVHHYGFNLFGFNIGNNPQRAGAGGHPNNNKNQIWNDFTGSLWTTIAGDTTHGSYATYGTNVSIDSTTIFYTNRIGSFPFYRLTTSTPSYLRGAGKAWSITTGTKDLSGASIRSSPDIGYLQLNSSGNFTYTITAPCTSSAGVYNTSGVLIRTIWSVKPESAGLKSGYWDGNDDFGNTASGEPFSFKVLSSNVSYTWNGVIGNTSTVQTGYHTIGGSFGDATTGGGAVTVGNIEYWASGYGEGTASRWRTTTSDINYRISFVGAANAFTNEFVATDSQRVYWAWYDGFALANTGVYASTIGTDANYTFSGGSTYKGWSVAGYNGAGTFPNYEITGLAVQKTANFLILTRKGINQVLVINKTTGATATTTTITGAGRCAVDGGDKVWIADNVSVKQYSIDGSGNLTATGASIGLSNVGGLACSPNGTKLAICDMSAQQVKQYNLTGTLLNTLGTGISYQTDPSVANNKFYWSDTSGTYYFTFVSYMADSSILIGDRANGRVQHFDKDWITFIESQAYVSRLYNMAADNNDASRVFGNLLEYSIDYTKPIGSCWSLTKNWGGKNALSSNGLQPVTINKGAHINNRTYTMMRGASFTFYPYELVPGYGLRLAGTGRNFANGYAIDPATGDLIAYVISGGTYTARRYALTGFDGSNNPTWSGSFTGTPVTITSTGPDQSNGFNSNVGVTNLGDWIYFGQQPDDTTAGNHVIRKHLGSAAAGSSSWKWTALMGTDRYTYIGPFPGQGISPSNGGFFDNGNKVVGAGRVFSIYKDNVVIGYHGEFWKNAQTNYYWHYDDSTGLLIGQFGKSWSDYPTYGGASSKTNYAPAQVTGNALNGTMVKGSDSVLYLYQGEEVIHDGIHRWQINGLNTVSHQTATFIGGNAPSVLGTDLLSGFSRGTTDFAYGTSGWTRSTADFNNGNGSLITKTGTKSYDQTKSTDLSVVQQTNVAGTDIRIGRPLIAQNQRSNAWQVSFDPLWDNNIPNQYVAPPYTGGSYIEVLDSVGKIIAEIHMAEDIDFEYLVMNGTYAMKDSNLLSVYRTYTRVKPNNQDGPTVTLTYVNGTLTMVYQTVNGPVTSSVTSPFQVGATMTQPYILQMHFFENSAGGVNAYGKGIQIQNAFFNPAFANPGQYFIRHAGKLYFK